MLSPNSFLPTSQPPGGQSPTIGGQMDPESAYLASALKGLGQQPMGSPTGLGSNLLADALLMYGYNQRQQQLTQQNAIQNTQAAINAGASTAAPDGTPSPDNAVLMGGPMGAFG